MCRWTNTNTWTHLQMCIKFVLISRKPRIVTTRWPQNCRQNSMRSKLSAVRLSHSSKNSRDLLLKMLFSQELERKFQRKHLKSGKKVSLWKIKKFINIGYKTLLWGIDLPIRKRSSKRESNLLMVSISLISNNSKLRTKHSTRRLKRETKNSTSFVRKSLKPSSSSLTLVRSFNTSKSRTISKTKNSKTLKSNWLQRRASKVGSRRTRRSFRKKTWNWSKRQVSLTRTSCKKTTTCER